MQTKKVTLSELKEMNNFKAVNRKDEVADFTVNHEDLTAVAKFENGKSRTMKLDSIRRSWLVIIEEDNNEEENEMQENLKEELKEVSEQVNKVVQDTVKKEELKEEVAKKPEKKEEPKKEKKKENAHAVNIDLTKVFDGDAISNDKEINEYLAQANDEKYGIVKKMNEANDTQHENEIDVELSTGKETIKFIEGFTEPLKKEVKTFSVIAFRNYLIEITEYQFVTCGVSVTDEAGTILYRSKKQSLKDALMNYLEISANDYKVIQRAITKLKKASRANVKVKSLT